MARPLRIEYEGAFYHITSRGNERKRIYHTESDYNRFKHYLKRAQIKYDCKLHCYVLMTNHYHLLLETPRGNLHHVMHYINGSYTNYLNRKLKKSGHLFQGRYKAILIDSDKYMLTLSRYLHLNPVRAEMVEKPEEYKHSSYRTYLQKEGDDFVHRNLVLEMVSTKRGEAIRKYRDYVELGLVGEEENPFKEVYGGMILGTTSFVKQTLKRMKEGEIHREEISHRRKLRTALGYEEVVAVLRDEFNLSSKSLIDCSKHQRSVAVYLLKSYTGLTNKELSELFGNITYSGVSKIHQRFQVKMKHDRSLRKQIQQMKKKLSHVKG